MNKETLDKLCKNCERHLNESQKLCPFRSISNDYCEEYDELLKAIKILDILKPRIHLNHRIFKNDLEEFNIAYVEATGYVFNDTKEYQLLHEWLKNDNNQYYSQNELNKILKAKVVYCDKDSIIIKRVKPNE